MVEFEISATSNIVNSNFEIFTIPIKRKMDIQLYLIVISKILISAYFNNLDIAPEYLNMTIEYMRCLAHQLNIQILILNIHFYSCGDNCLEAEG